MLKIQSVLLALYFLLTSLSYAQGDNVLTTDDGTFWTLPITECSGENSCQMRVSPEGTIYNWDMVHRLLYVSRKNEASFTTYDLSGYKQSLLRAIDFVPFEVSGHVVFYSDAGPVHLTRYDLASQSAEVMQFPDGFDLIGCNIWSGTDQLELRMIFQVGLANQLMVCTTSPEKVALIQLIDVNTLTIQSTLDIRGFLFFPGLEPGWQVLGGFDNRIYVFTSYPQDVIPNLPAIDEATEAIILIYDVDEQEWSYIVIPHDGGLPGILVAALPDDTLYQMDGWGLNQYSTQASSSQARQPLRQIEIEGIYLRFLGLTLDGTAFLSGNGLYIAAVSDYPLLVESPVANAGPDQTLTDTDSSGSEGVILDGSASTASDGTIVNYVWMLGGTEIATDATPTVDLPVGAHAITLTVTDNDGLTAADDVVIAVKSPQ